jgi:class 3 adenylate cyclase
VLVVDDEPANRALLERWLQRHGHRVTTAASGPEALDQLRAGGFDLVLLDVMMPGMDGYQVLQQIKDDPSLRETRVIMISALDDVDTVVRYIELGAEDYLSKPFNPVLLKARISASLEKKRLRDWQRRMFGAFAAPEVAEDVLTGGFTLGGRYVDATALFADIRSFTAITESQPPAATIELLNRFFDHVIAAIESEEGIVNQIVGDGLMAIFGAPRESPDHRRRAVEAARQMIARLETLNATQRAEGKPEVRIGIGIASGRVIAGYTGTRTRVTYTCVGDPVNLAARLEALTKELGRPILIDQATREGLPPEAAVTPEGTAEVRGRSQPVLIYSVNLDAR